MLGSTQGQRTFSEGRYIGDGNPGPHGGGTYTNAGGGGEHETVMRNYEEIFGPSARDIKYDSQRSKRHQRWHLPDTLAGYNPFLTDRIDGLITDATNSPFTSVILPYQYVSKPDGKLKWNAWSFDEGMASRVPYESAARVLTQTKRSFAAYTVRQGLAIVMEHNFMASPEGMENFRNQVKQMVGSIQYTNDLDVHMALIQAPSYARTIAEKYHTPNRTPQQLVRQYIDLFGIVQKNPNALDLLIEEAKAQMRDWGSQEPTFLLCNGKLTMQLTMSPEKTNYVTQGIDGVKRLRAGPDIPSYRGVNIIKSRAFSMEKNMPPRDVLRRRVRVAEYYWIPADAANVDRSFEFYDQGRDSWVTFKFPELLQAANMKGNYLTTNWAEDNALPARAQTDPADHVDFRGHMLGAAATLGAACMDPMQDSPFDYSTTTKMSVAAWNIKPYNLKIGILSSLGGLVIEADGEQALHCNSVFDTDEAGFVQMVQQAANLADVQSTLLPHVYASAWIGGGLFNDTTYHLKKGNSYLAPLCNWASLDARRMSDNSGSEVDMIFQFATTVNSVHTIRDRVTDKELLAFMPYQPNRYVFDMENAHSEANRISTVNSHTTTAMRFASSEFTAPLVKRLMSKVCVDSSTQREFHNFLVPFRAMGSAPETDICDRLDKMDQGRNPFNTVIMCMLMSYLHPSKRVRDAATTALGGAPAVAHVQDHLVAYATRGGNLADLPVGNELTDVAWMDLGVEAPFAPTACSVGATPEDTGRIFALIACKRLFCGAPRFSHGGNPANPVQYGLSLLSRSYAFLGTVTKEGKVHQNVKGSSKVHKVGPAGAATHHLLLVRPNIEHEMLGMILGRGGTAELGATLWGQTELSCYDDSQHGIWGMSYKYHERAQVFNERNMVRTWDIAFDGYNGGLGSSLLDWEPKEMARFANDTEDFTRPYNGKDFIVMAIPIADVAAATPEVESLGQQLPNPIIWFDNGAGGESMGHTMTDPENIHRVATADMRIYTKFTPKQRKRYNTYRKLLPDFAGMEHLRKIAGNASAANESSPAGSMAFQGTMRVRNGHNQVEREVNGSGHLGNSYVGVAAVRDGKGILVNGQPTLTRFV